MKARISVLMLIICLSVHSPTTGQIITTVAGNHIYTLDNPIPGPALSTSLSFPQGVITDNAGNVYFSDLDACVVWKLDPSGTLSMYAGNGTPGYSGDGGPATAAELRGPASIHMDATGNLYIVDQAIRVIRKVSPTGIITTFAGIIPPSLTNNGDGGPATAASFQSINDITVDAAGNVYAADFMASVIRKIDTKGIITTFAGNGTYGYTGDGGPAIAASFWSARGLAVDQAGNIYVADAAARVVRKIATNGIITTIAGNGTRGYSGDGGPATNAELDDPWSLAIDNTSNIYLGNGGNPTIRKIAPNGIITTYAGNGAYGYSGDGGPPTAAEFNGIDEIATDNAGNLYICDYGNYVVRKITICPLSTISMQPANAYICTGANASFSCSASTASTATGYQWQTNTSAGWANIGDDATYSGSSTANLTITAAGQAMNQYQFRCFITNACGITSTSAATLTVSSATTPSIQIDGPSIVCSGINALFTATASGGGTGPIYQWQLNGANIGGNSSDYSSNSFANGDQLSCTFTSNAACVSTSQVTSNTITIALTPAVTPTVTIGTPSTSICSGTTATFEANASGGGTNPSFQWQLNGRDIGDNSPDYSSNALANGDRLSCTMTSNAICATSPFTLSNTLSMTVNPTPSLSMMPDTIIPYGASLRLYANTDPSVTSYQWTPATGLDNPTSPSPNATPSSTTTWQLIVTTSAGCTDSGKVTIGVFRHLGMPGAFTPNNDGHNDLFRVPPSIGIRIKNLAVYNRWGLCVFRSSNTSDGWDGVFAGQPQPAGAYIWQLEYTDPLTGQPQHATGTVILIR